MTATGNKGVGGSISVRRSIMLAFGFGCLVGYVRMVSLGFVGYFSAGVIESVDPWYELRSAITVIALVMLALSGLFHWFAINRGAIIATVVAGVATVIIYAVGSEGALGPVAAVVGGASIAVLMYIWMLFLSSLRVQGIVIVTVAGLFVSGALIMGVPRIDSTVGLFVSAVCVIVAGSVVLLEDPELSTCVPDGKVGRSGAARIPWLTIVMVLTCGFLATVLYGICEHYAWMYGWSPNYAVFGIAAAGVVVSTAVMMLRRADWIHIVWIPQFIALVCALALSCFTGNGVLQVAVGFLLASVFCAHFLHWTIFSSIFSALRIPRAFLAGIILLAVNGSFASMTGDALAQILPEGLQDLGGVAGFTMVILVIVGAVTMFVYRRTVGVVGFFDGTSVRGQETQGDTDVAEHDGVESEDAPVESDGRAGGPLSPTEALEAHMERYVSEFGLTPREAEVALLTVQGFSCAYIADKLVVSNSTVRFHQQNLFRKFDVHSRDQLIERVVSADVDG